MKSVVVREREDPIQVRTRDRVLDALLAARLPVSLACGGKGLCATCHVYVESGPELLSPKTPREERALKMICDARPNSRLSCQAKVLADGALIRLPKGLYFESTSSLEQLVGKRADQRILHPVDGRVLIEAGKIITRSRILELANVEVDVKEMQSMAMTID